MRRFREEIDHWKEGAFTNGPADKISLNATPRARNTAWIGAGIPTKRKGCALLMLEGELPDRPQILALGHFNDLNWTISTAGSWNKIIPDGDYFESVPIDSGNTTPFTTPGLKIPSTTVANNLLFAVNGTDALKTNGTTISNFGIVAPTGYTVVDAAVAGSPNGTYSIGVSGYNSATGHESSMGAPLSVAVVNSRIDVTFPAAPADVQITHWRVHIFKTSLTDRYFRLTDTGVTPTGGTYSSADGGWTVATDSVRINVTDANINALVIQSPSTHENNPPPTGVKTILYHGSRMFVSEGTDLWYSKDGFPESFDPIRVEHINRQDGQDIVGLASLSEHHILIFKENSCYSLTGPDDPNTWEVEELDLSVGLKSLRSIVNTNHGVWWEADQGIYRVEPGAYPVRMDSPRISNHLEGCEDSNLIVGAYDGVRERVLFSIPLVAAGDNEIILPFNERLGIWEDVWDPLRTTGMGIFYDSLNIPFVALGGKAGRVYRLWAPLPPYLDGVRADDGTDPFTLSGNPTASTNTSITDSAASFDVTGDRLKEAVLMVVSPDGIVQRRYITTNTETTITVTADWDSNPTTAYTYYIGSPNFEFDTKYMAPTSALNGGSIFNSRKFKRCLIKGVSDTGSATLDVYAILDHITNSFAAHVQATLEGSGSVFDIDLFDVATFGTQLAKVTHRTLGISGRVCGLRVTNRTPGVGVMLLGLGIMGTEHGYKE